MSDYLPADLITGILLRLPVAAILRCRCVSRAWRALIDSPKFKKLQMDYSAATAKNAVLFINEVHGDYVLADYVNGLRRGIELDIVSTPPAESTDPRKVYALLGSCNGLICFACDWDRILVTNHATRQSYLVPAILKKPTSAILLGSLNGQAVTYGAGFGFGYDSVSDDYKVVQIVHVLKPQEYSFQCELITYGVRSNSRVAMVLPYFLIGSWSIGVSVGGALHFIVRRVDDLDGKGVILGFDLGLNECREVPQPEYPNGRSFSMGLGEMGKCLCIFANYRDKFVDVWMMKEYGVKESWSVMFSVPHPGLCYNDDIRPLGLSMTGQEVLLLLDLQRLVWYDLKDPQNVAAAEEITIHESKRVYMDAVVCFRTLAPPDGKFPPLEEKEVKVGKATAETMTAKEEEG